MVVFLENMIIDYGDGNYQARVASLMHAALIISKRIGVASKGANDALRKELESRDLTDLFNELTRGRSVEEYVENNKQLRGIVNQINLFRAPFDVVTVRDQRYPERLAREEGVPPVLYFRGDLSLLEAKTLGVIGTRRLGSLEVRQKAREYVASKVKEGYVIVSGLALGSDTLGHETALTQDGKTVAVLGVPINKYYPEENTFLQEDIATNHLLVSQYPIGIRTYGSFFVGRNIVTAGLSDEMFIVESDDKSGTVHCIRFAYQQGKTINIMPQNLGKGRNWVRKYRERIKEI